MFRIIDANINRICEGLRVIEEILRFEFNDNFFFKSLKELRHKLRQIFSYIDCLKERDSINDCGKELNKIEINRNNIFDLLKANFLRAQEGLRVLEEIIKFENKLSQYLAEIKSFRFKVYNLEKEILLRYWNLNKLKNYAIIGVNKEPNIILSYIEKNDISSVQLENFDNKFENVKFIRNFCLDKGISVFIKNSIELAIILDSDGIVIDKYYYNFYDIRKNYKKLIGFIVKDRIDCYHYDFFIIENIDLISSLLDKNKVLLVREEDYNKIEYPEKINTYKNF